MPFDTAQAGEAIVVMFDRPVASSLDRAPDPARFVRIEPALSGVIQWRDPQTIRIIPDEPPRSGRHTITVAEFAAEDGGRLVAPYVFTVHTFGPRFLGRLPALSEEAGEILEPTGRVTLFYTAPVDTSVVSRVTRLELKADGPCAGGTVRFDVTLVRPALPTELRRTTFLYDYDNFYPYRTALELQSRTPIPAGCLGTWIVPSFDPRLGNELRRRAITMPPFQIAHLGCTADDCAMTPSLQLTFSAPVERRLLVDKVHIEPATPFTIEEHAPTAHGFVIRLPVKMRTTYKVTVDSTLVDVYGRPLTGESGIALAIGDRRPALGHQLGFLTLSRQHPVIRITHVNADSVDLAIVPVPDSLVAAVVAASGNPDSVARIVGRLRDTVHHMVVLRRKPNVEQVTDIRLPETVLGSNHGTLLAIRGRGFLKLPPPPRVPRVIRTVGEIQEIQIIASMNPLSNFVALVQITDLVAHAKVDAAWGSVLVTNINSGQPVAGANVILRDRGGQVAATGTTDVTGVADLQRAPHWRDVKLEERSGPYWYFGYGYYGDRPRLIEVTRGGDRSMTIVSPYSRESEMLELGYADRSYDRDRFMRGMVYTERPIYRPGEVVYLASILRQGWLGNLTVPRGDSVRVSVTSGEQGPRDAEILRQVVLRLNEFGSATDSFAIPRAATLGGYSVRLEAVVDSTWRTIAWRWFRVAEYRAPEFKTTVSIDTVVRFLGDTIRARVSSRYYFGAAMAGAVVRWAARTSDVGGRVPIPGLPRGFIIGRRYDSYNLPGREADRDEVSGVDTLDAAGSATLAIPTTPGTLNEPGQLEVTVATEDLNREMVMASATKPIHASGIYVAVRDPGRDWYWRRDVPRPLDVMTVRSDGRRVGGVHVGIVVLRHRWVWSSTTSSWATDTISRDSLVTADSVVRYTYTPRTDEMHQVLFTIPDRHGRPLTTSIARYVVSADERFAAGASRASLSVHVSPDTVTVGDTARVQFLSPFQRAEAWVTVEREGMLMQRRLTVGAGETTIPIGVTSPLVPGATIGVTLIDSTAAWKTDSLHQRIRVGRTALHVAPHEKRLRVDIIADKDRYEPGDTARIRVQVRDHLMRPASGEITLWAVDESVIALADYEGPNPFETMFAPRGSGLTFASTATTLAQLRPNMRPAGWYVDFYGRAAANSMVSLLANAAGQATSTLRSNFRTTAFFLSGLRTDPTGWVATAVKLPDNVTTYRLFAVAATADDRFGAGQTSVLVTKPLLARTALPRFLRTGDHLLAGAVLTNQTGRPTMVNVRASGRATTPENDTRLTRALGADSSAEVRFEWRTHAEPGDTAAFRFDIDGGGYGDAVMTTLPVRPPYSPRFHTATGVARGRTTVRMFLPPELDPTRSRLTLRLGTSPVTIVRSNYWRLHVYPYLCTEQLTSAGEAILAVLRLQHAGLLDSMTAPRAEDLRRELQSAVDALSRRQTEEGGIGYWGPSAWTDARLTTYAGSMLLSARQLGLEVPDRTLASITDYLTQVPIPPADTVGVLGDRRGIGANRLALQLARLDYLRRAGAPDAAGEEEIARREADMLWEDRVLLAQLLVTRGDSSRARDVLARAWRLVDFAGNRLAIADPLVSTAWFPSRVRPIARLVRATVAIDPTHPGIAAGIESLVSQQRALRSWVWNTHDYAAASAALSDIAIWQRSIDVARSLTVRSVRKHRADRVVLMARAGANRDSTISLAGLVEREGDWLVLPLRLEAGAGPVYYSLTVDEVPRSLPAKSDARGVIVQRWFERFDDGTPVTEVKEGELVRGRLRITLPDRREFLAVEDLLPAGLEVVDLSLKTSSTLDAFETPESRAAKLAGDRANSGRPRYGTWYGDWWSPWEHQEIRDDRVVYFARELGKGTYTASYVAPAPPAGTFVRPPAHAEEMYNQSLGGRSDGGVFRITPK
jgi:uncharacterized protein YfaS (alpha-2-macroglobulin family)